MADTNAGRIKRHKERMQRAGFQRVRFWAHPDLLDYLERRQRPHECLGRTLERLLLGESQPRPGTHGAPYTKVDSEYWGQRL